eukprot:6545838-Alexandrium_andersonii.AAC.1
MHGGEQEARRGWRRPERTAWPPWARRWTSDCCPDTSTPRQRATFENSPMSAGGDRANAP